MDSVLACGCHAIFIPAAGDCIAFAHLYWSKVFDAFLELTASVLLLSIIPAKGLLLFK